jgi:hypothetical protein
MKTIFSITLIIISTNLLGQSAQQEINDQVWKPLIKAFNEKNEPAFMAVHSKDIISSSRDFKTIFNWTQYNAQTEKWDVQEKKFQPKRQLDLRFTERLSNQDQAIDVGIYKTTYTQPNGKTQNYFGRLHAALRKENGVWKILVSTDSSEGGTISEKDFLAATPVE